MPALRGVQLGFHGATNFYHSIHCPISIEANPAYRRWLRKHYELEAQLPETFMAAINEPEKQLQLDRGRAGGSKVDDDVIYQRVKAGSIGVRLLKNV